MFEKDDTENGFGGVNPAVLEKFKALFEETKPDARPGPDWVTCKELGSLWKISHGAARHRVDRLIKQGLVESQMLSQGHGGRVVYYRIKTFKED